MFDSVRPHRRQPNKLPRPWDSPGKNTGVGCCFLFQCMKVKSESEVAQLCPTLCDPPGLQPTRLLHPWEFPGKSAGVGCHFLLQCMKVKSESEVATPWTAAHQAPPSMGVSRQECWSRLPFPSPVPSPSVQFSSVAQSCLTLQDPMYCSLPVSSVHWIFQARILEWGAIAFSAICQQIWKTQQWPQDWKRSVFIPIPKKGNAEECSNYHTIALISHVSKVMLKILQARL